MVTCPKCGYEQDQRLDCLKCGIVFNKYIAAHNGEKTAGIGSGEASQPSLFEGPSPATLYELRQTLRELSRRSHDVEFERAERNRLRGDLSNLDRRLDAAIEPMTARLDTLEQRASAPPPPPPPVTLSDQPALKDEIHAMCLGPLLERLEQIESRLQTLEQRVELLTHPAEENAEPRPPLEEDVHVIRKNLDQIRLFVTQLGPAT